MKMLILAPHQDDELILCGSFLRKMTEANEVYIVFTTNGDYNEETRYVRLEEALKVGLLYGLKQENIIFLGYANEYREDGPHIYDAGTGEVVYSQYGNCYTYGLSNHPEYCFRRSGEHHLYTRDNFKQDLKDVIIEILPDVIFATDVEIHPDHKANSLMLDEVIGEILREKNDYIPIILKKPGYSTSWFGENDFTPINNREAQLRITNVRVNGHKSIFYNPYFKWNDRIRLPIDRQAENGSAILYKALNIYKSQNAVKHYEAMNNSDVVFWQRRTDSITYQARIVTSSGNASFLNDFKIVDSSSIKRKQVDSWNVDKSVWRPDLTDLNPRIDIYLKSEETLDEIVIYQEYYPMSKIEKCHILLDDINKVDVVGLKADRATKIRLGGIRASKISVIIDEVSDKSKRPGITEIEVYKAQERKPLYAKVLVHNNFIYEYHCTDNISLPLQIYEWWNDGSVYVKNLDDYTIEIFGEQSKRIQITGSRLSGEITKEISVSVKSKYFPQVIDEIKIIPSIKPKLVNKSLIDENIGIYCGKTADYIASLSYGEIRAGMESYVKEFIRGIICEDNSVKTPKGKKIYLLGTPDHYNIGDHAITIATYKMIRSIFPDADIEEIPIMQFARKLPYLLRNIRPQDLMVLQGGGNMGNIYWRNERIRREVIKHFPNNLKIIFPETIYYENNEEGKRDFDLSKEIYCDESIIIFAREKKSYEIMRQAYSKCRVYLVPDIVCSLAPYGVNKVRSSVGLCFRSDLEKSITLDEEAIIIKEINRRNEKYKYLDMMSHSRGYLGKSNRLRIVQQKIEEIGSFKYVITDRLHGMIFCYITGTPCLVVSKYNHKIESYYKTWFENVPYISMMGIVDEPELKQKLDFFDNLKDCSSEAMNFTIIREVLNEWEKIKVQLL